MLLDDFEREYADYHNLSEDRRASQRRAVRRLTEDTGKDVLDCTASDIRQHLAGMRESGMRAA